MAGEHRIRLISINLSTFTVRLHSIRQNTEILALTCKHKPCCLQEEVAALSALLQLTCPQTFPCAVVTLQLYAGMPIARAFCWQDHWHFVLQNLHKKTHHKLGGR